MEALTPEELAWLAMDEKRWARARTIAAAHPDLDLGDLYHTLVNFERTPDERLALDRRLPKLAPPAPR